MTLLPPRPALALPELHAPLCRGEVLACILQHLEAEGLSGTAAELRREAASAEVELAPSVMSTKDVELALELKQPGYWKKHWATPDPFMGRKH